MESDLEGKIYKMIDRSVLFQNYFIAALSFLYGDGRITGFGQGVNCYSEVAIGLILV